MRLMKLAGLLTAIFGCQLCWSDPIYYEVENPGGDVWQYSYTAGNETSAAIDTWIGDGTPGVQPYTLYGDDLPPLLGDNLFTRPLLAGDVPEPGTLLLFVAGLLGLAAVRRRRTSIRGRSSAVWAAV